MGLSKWNKNVSKYCMLCKNDIETTSHMIFYCDKLNWIWENISCITGFKISYKEIVCGYLNYERSKILNTINHVISLVAYSIFKSNSHCKFEECDYNINIIKQQIATDMRSFLNFVSFTGKENEFVMRIFSKLM